MSDYIERQKAIDAVKETFKRIPTTAIRAMDSIKAVSSADVVQVVRCKDCERSEYDVVFESYWCKLRRLVKPDDFCSYGERKERAG